MKPSLELANRLQSTMIVICATILLIAFSPLNTEKNENAIEALKYIARLPIDSTGLKLHELSIELNKTIETCEVEFHTNLSSKEDYLTLFETWNVRPYEYRPILTVLQSRKIKDIITFLKYFKQIQIYCPDPKLLVDTIASIVSLLSLKDQSYMFQYLKMMKYYENKMKLWKIQSIAGQKKLRKPLLPPPPPPPIYDDPYYSIDVEAVLKSVKTDSRISKIQSDIQNILLENRILFINKTDRVINSIDTIGIELGDLTPEEAIRSIQKNDQESRNYSLLGISIDSKLALIGAPLALCFILLLYCFLLYHISCNVNADIKMIALYPAPFSFSGTKGIISLVLLYLVIPTFSSVSLSYRAWNRVEFLFDQSTTLAYINSAITVIQIVIACFTFMASLSIRKQIFSK
jgi:hypothetical protein